MGIQSCRLRDLQSIGLAFTVRSPPKKGAKVLEKTHESILREDLTSFNKTCNIKKLALRQKK